MAIHHYSARSAHSLERYLKVSELAKETGIPLRTIYTAIERGEIVTFKPRGCKRGQRISESEARRWLAECTE